LSWLLLLLLCAGDTEEEDEQDNEADADYATASESASQSQLDISGTDDAQPDMEVKSPAVETQAPKIASPVQQVKAWDEILIVKNVIFHDKAWFFKCL